MGIHHLSFMLFIAVCILSGCNDDSDGSHSSNNSGSSVTQVTFIDNGAVVPAPVSTTVTIKSDSIQYTSSQSETVIEEWSKEIESSDFDSVQGIIDDYDLTRTDDIMPVEGDEEECEGVGWRGMTITIDERGNSYSFDINGGVCSEQWPEGVNALVDLKDDLVEKYQ